ncbi:hypothetical protein H5833_09065 [Klebsiella pneumoniae]|uniref:hypothetical protein n=1 Tax=Klebsiella pneumoniae TaxID=573 RepID=UPI00165498E3|nr:hypothetical protein [Klebsiella pneumoniae]HDT4677571.1 hypothetical protein [Klebsiella pneumoniae subsp. pneumoniae]MCB3448062.1 hypothetical protein [Klebsiella pneumoniae]QNN13685.1 hypothetical protein IAI03_09235 [Klebsiella pneumoniae]HBS0033705.1 hypothetical protein [Klebsiella pneumoniae]HBV3433315.1 hypothetical protein [Klebsiella pneumoniae]
MRYILKIGIAASLCCLSLCIYAVFNGGYYGPRHGDLENVFYVALVTSIASLVCFILLLLNKRSIENEISNDIVSLWIKRRRLEEQQRIRDLESKN